MDRELAGCKFRDVRLEERFRKLFEQLSGGLGESIPTVCQDSREHESSLPFFLQQACERRRDFGRTFPVDTRTSYSRERAGI
jgi:hypothetical protein